MPAVDWESVLKCYFLGGVAFLLILICRFMRENSLHISSMTPAWLLPIASCVVASASGAIVADILSNAPLALAAIPVSYILWGLIVVYE